MAQTAGSALARPIDAARYRDVLGRYATGVTIVTTFDRPFPVGAGSTGAGEPRPPGDAGNGQPFGTTVNAFTSVSLDPPLVLVCIGRERSIHPVLTRTGRFAVNILAEGSRALSDCFAGAPSELPRSAFCDARYGIGEAGMPVLDEALAAIECDVDRVIPAGDHTIYLGRVLDLSARDRTAWPLLYYRGRYLRIEHAETAELRGKPDAT